MVKNAVSDPADTVLHSLELNRNLFNKSSEAKKKQISF